MKICILSMQRVPNFGSLMQSYALKQVLEQMGHTVSFLDIEKNEQDNLLLHPNHVDSKKQNKWQVIRKKLMRIDRYAFNRVYIRKLADKQKLLFEKFCDEVLLEGKPASGQHDCCVIGSDEVFNCLSDAPWGFTSQLFGNVPQANRVITYAASCGATKIEKLPEPVAKKIQEAFTNVKAFSVRDENTRKFVNALTDKDVVLHADPVMISDFSEQIQETPLPGNLPKRYCVVYSYYNRIADPKEIEQIKAFCRKRKLELVTVGAPQMWIRRHLVLTPLEALAVLRNAEFVFTDTFHGTIFSAKYAKAFAVKTRPSNENKLGDLIDRFGLQKHKVTQFSQVDSAENFAVDPELLKDPVQKHREESLNYLKTMIQ